MKQVFTAVAAFVAVLYLVVVVFFQIKDPHY